MIERRAGLNFRVQGRTVSGTALRYGDVADMGRFREMFVSGAFRPIGSVALNLQHDESRVLAKTGNGLVLADGPRSLEVRAELSGKAEHELVRRGVLRGFSIEFRAKNQRYEGGTRIIESAELTGIALCDEPAYPESIAEARRARGTGKTARLKAGRVLRSTIPYNTALACECLKRGGGAACIPVARFSKVAGDAMSDAINSALAEARDILTVASTYSRPLASASKGTLRATSTADALEIEVDLPSGPLGDEVVAAHSAAGIVARPLIDFDRSEFTDGPDGRSYTKPWLRAILIGSTDAKSGWPDPVIEKVPEGPPTTTKDKKTTALSNPGSPWTADSLRFGNRLRRTCGCGSIRRLSA